MNHEQSISIILVGSALLVSATIAVGQSETNSLNRFRFTPRAAFNITGRFKDAGSLSLTSNGRATPNGSSYNYDDGYVLTDVSGNAGGQTWNWGYDSSSQISGNTILMHRTTPPSGTTTEAGTDLPDASLGFELAYDRELGSYKQLRYGVEGAVNYMNISLHANSYIAGNVARTTDAYSFATGATPPSAPYQGTFNGPGFLVGSSPVNTTSSSDTAMIAGSQQLDADVWGVRAGPYLELPLDERIDLFLSGGLSLALLNTSASWTEAAAFGSGGSANGSGSGSDMSFFWGGYIGVTMSWELSKHLSVDAGAQYQYLGIYQQTLGGRAVELDLSQSVLVTLGMSYSF